MMQITAAAGNGCKMMQTLHLTKFFIKWQGKIKVLLLVI